MMSWGESLATALRAIRTHTLRSALTVVGILIGIAAVVLTVGLGLGSQKDVTDRIAALGSNLLIVTPGSQTSMAGIRGGFGSGTTLTTADAAALTDSPAAPDIRSVAAEKTSSAERVHGSTNWTTQVTGTTPSWVTVRGRELGSGAFLTADHVEAGANVIVLGSETATELFGGTDATGRSLTIDGTTFSVIGVLKAAGSSSATNLDDMAVIPATTAARLDGSSTATSVNRIYLEATSAKTLGAAYQEAHALLLNLHSATSSSAADFTISSQDALVDAATSIYRTLTVLLVGIAAISLLVGGIGVMNIMLVSVTERTREIGLRKALGATPRAIRRQFLIEATVLGVAGGLLGAALGVLGARTLPGVLSATIVVSVPALIGSIAVALGVGLLFGVYPATRAARLTPIDALRAE